MFVKQLSAFCRLIRWPNLVFIILTQYLFTYCVLDPIFAQAGIVPNVQGKTLALICLSSVLIAAGGYIINDYFDLNIDLVNKPQKLVIGKYIHRHWAIACHSVLSAIGIIIGFYLDFTTHIHLLGVWNFACTALLFLYSISLKRQPVAGNILIALLTAWTILVITWCETSQLIDQRHLLNIGKISRFSFLYAGFAFVISLVREVVKDMEDVEGDGRFGCKTMPILWGMYAAKVFAAVWLVVLIGILAIVQFYVIQFKWIVSAIYSFLFVLIPLLYIFRLLIQAHTPVQFHKLSTLIKWVMLLGILSMIFIRLGM